MRSTALLVGCLMSLCSAALARDYYVSTGGSDKNPGTREKPFCTIQKAADKMVAGDTCYVRGGLYREVVRPKCSGSRDKPIRFEAWPGEVVILSGTEPIRSRWSVHPVRSPDRNSGTSPVRLTSNGVHKGNIYRTRVSEAFDQLFVDGRMMIEARWPNMRFDQRFDKSVWATAGKGSAYGTMVDPALAETCIDWTGATATLNVGSWQTWRRTVRDHKAGSDRFAYDRNLSSRLESKRKWEGFDRYFLSGKLEALDIPTEWHLDRGSPNALSSVLGPRNSRTLYLWAPDGDNPAGHNVEAKVRDYVFDAYEREFIELRGFHFFGATFRFIKCNHCIIDCCHLRFPTRAHGLDPAPLTLVDGSNNIMRNCSVVYSDGPAVTMSGANNTLENCLFHDIDWHGLIRGLGVNMGASATSVIRRCTMFNIGSSEGLVVPSKGPSVVEYNYIHNVGLVQSDGALIQSHGIQLAGTVIRYNWVHDHNAFNWGGNGIRGDDLTRNLLVHHNVVWNCREKGIIVKGDYNRVFNNTCLRNPKIDIIAPSRAEPFKPWAPKQHSYLLEKQNANTHIANNCAPVITGTFSWQKRKAPPLGRMESNYRGKNPMLTSPPEAGMIGPAGLDFSPQPGSPLIDAGKPIPGITDGYQGKAPDIGAYDFGGRRWLPGCRNGLWVSAPQKQANRTVAIRISLRMPPTEPVFLTVTLTNPDVSLKTGETLTFTSANWMHAQTVILRGYGRFPAARGPKTPSLQFSDKHLGSAEISDVWAINPRLGRVVTFDLP